VRIGSLFSGIGGFELGLEAAGVGHVVFTAEKEPFCQHVLALLYPEAVRFSDVESITAATAPAVDLLCGGFPCQDISLAGTGAGLAGPRSSLWWQYARIIGELRPRYVCIENVAALLVRGGDEVLSSLAALGYDAFWDCLPASAIGAPHERDRLYMVAWAVPDAGRNGERLEPERGPGAARAPDRGHPEPIHVGAGLADADEERRGENECDGAGQRVLAECGAAGFGRRRSRATAEDRAGE